MKLQKIILKNIFNRMEIIQMLAVSQYFKLKLSFPISLFFPLEDKLAPQNNSFPKVSENFQNVEVS